MLRNLFKEKLGYEVDEDFRDHVPVDQEVVEEFVLRNGPGPDIEHLHLDCLSGRGSPWNQEAMQLILSAFQDAMDNDPAKIWPEYSNKYLSDMVWERFTRLIQIWRSGQRGVNTDGEEEGEEELETRLDGQRNSRVKAYRHFTRRQTVKFSIASL